MGGAGKIGINSDLVQETQSVIGDIRMHGVNHPAVNYQDE